MTDWLDNLGSYLVTQSIGTLGTDIFNNYMPATPDNCVTLYQSGGTAPDNVASWYNPGLQVRVRNTDQATGRTKAKTIIDAIHDKTFTSSTTLFEYVRALNDPYCLGLDANKRWEWTINFEITYSEVAI